VRVRDIFLNGIGVFLPEVQSVEAAVERGLYSADDVASRGYTGAAVAGEMPAPEMAVYAAQDALKRADVSPDDLIAVLHASVWHQGPEAWGPQNYLLHCLQRNVISDDLVAVEIRDNCSGVFSGIELALGCLRGQPPGKAALITSSDNFGTPLFDRWSAGGGSTVMGDGASALVMSEQRGFAQLKSICSAIFCEMEEVFRVGEPMFPPGVTIGREVDLGSRYEKFQEEAIAEGVGTEMMITHQLRSLECANRALTEAGVSADEISKVIVHNHAREESAAHLGMLGFPLARSTWEYGSGIGHIGASDHLISLHHLVATGQLGPGDHALLFGFSPGTTYKSAVVQILETPPWVPGEQPVLSMTATDIGGHQVTWRYGEDHGFRADRGSAQAPR
jgi:clorobiocin biosynthesis protein CloN2